MIEEDLTDDHILGLNSLKKILLKEGIHEEIYDFSVGINLYEFNDKIYKQSFLTLNSDGRKKRYLVDENKNIFAPTGIVYEKSIFMIKTMFCKDGLLHNDISHAYIAMYLSTNESYKVYFLNGEDLTFEEFCRRQKDTEYAPKILALIYGEKDKIVDN